MANSKVAKIKSYIDAYVERLAEAEHEGWTKQRARNSWAYGSPRDNAKKLQPLMVSYS